MSSSARLLCAAIAALVPSGCLFGCPPRVDDTPVSSARVDETGYAPAAAPPPALALAPAPATDAPVDLAGYGAVRVWLSGGLCVLDDVLRLEEVWRASEAPREGELSRARARLRDERGLRPTLIFHQRADPHARLQAPVPPPPGDGELWVLLDGHARAEARGGEDDQGREVRDVTVELDVTVTLFDGGTLRALRRDRLEPAVTRSAPGARMRRPVLVPYESLAADAQERRAAALEEAFGQALLRLLGHGGGVVDEAR